MFVSTVYYKPSDILLFDIAASRLTESRGFDTVFLMTVAIPGCSLFDGRQLNMIEAPYEKKGSDVMLLMEKLRDLSSSAQFSDLIFWTGGEKINQILAEQMAKKGRGHHSQTRVRQALEIKTIDIRVGVHNAMKGMGVIDPLEEIESFSLTQALIVMQHCCGLSVPNDCETNADVRSKSTGLLFESMRNYLK